MNYNTQQIRCTIMIIYRVSSVHTRRLHVMKLEQRVQTLPTSSQLQRAWCVTVEGKPAPAPEQGQAEWWAHLKVHPQTEVCQWCPSVWRGREESEVVRYVYRIERGGGEGLR